MVGKNRRRGFHLLVLAILTVGTLVIGPFLTSSLTGEQGWWSRLVWIMAGIIIYFLYLWWQARSQEERPEAIKERVSQLEPELRKQVQARSYGARRQLIEAPLRQLDLGITPRVGLVRDPRLIEPEPLSEKIAYDIVAAFESSKRRMLIVGEPGTGKTIAAYSLIEYLDNTEGDERIPLLVNLSAWEAQETFETFLVDYLCSSVGYEVHERAVASAFIDSGRYSLILDGLDEIPLTLRQHFSERLDTFVGGLPSEVGIVVTCRTQEYQEMLATHSTGLGLVQAVEILPLADQQLDSVFVELAKLDEDWEEFLSHRHHTAYQRVRELLSNPLFLNLAVVGRLNPGELLDWSTTEQELQDLVLDSYLDRTLADQRQYEPAESRRYQRWIASFLSGDEISPFGLRTTDSTVFDLANLTPPEPPRRYWLFGALAVGMVLGMVSALGWALVLALVAGPRSEPVSVLISELSSAPGVGQISALGLVLILALSYWLTFGPLLVVVLAVGLGLRAGRTFKRSAVSSRLTLVWPSTRRQLRDFLRRAGRGLILGLVLAIILALGFMLIEVLSYGLGFGLLLGIVQGSILGLVLGLVLALGFGLLETRSVLITSRTPKEAYSRSLIAALTWLVCGLLGGVVATLSLELVFRLGYDLIASLYRGTGPFDFGLVEELYTDMETFLGTVLVDGLAYGLVFGLILALRNGGWFVLLQKGAHRRLARAGNLPPRPYDFLEWGIKRQIFRRVGGGVRFRHNLIQQYLAKSHQQQPHEAEARSETRGQVLALAGVFLALAVWNTGLVGLALNNDLGWGLLWAIRDLLRLAVIILVTSGVVYLFLMRRQGVTFRETIFNWPMVAVAGAVALLLQFWYL